MDENELKRLIELQKVQDSFKNVPEEQKNAEMAQAMRFKSRDPLAARGQPMSPEEMMAIKARANALRQAREDAMKGPDLASISGVLNKPNIPIYDESTLTNGNDMAQMPYDRLNGEKGMMSEADVDRFKGRQDSMSKLKKYFNNK